MSNDGQEISTEQLLRLNRALKGGHFGQPVNLSIKAFKRYLSSDFPELSKRDRNYLVARYKEEAWSDYDEIVKVKFAEPSRTLNKKEPNGKQSEQATDLPLAGE